MIRQNLARIEKLRFLFGLEGVFDERSGGSGLAKKKNMGCYKRKDARGNKKNVSHKKARNRQSPHLRSAAHHAFQVFANPRNFACGVRAHSSCKIRSLIPREQVPRKRHPQNQSEKQATGKPKQFAPPFISAVNVRLR